jgi:predicted nucleotidyltransferase
MATMKLEIPEKWDKYLQQYIKNGSAVRGTQDEESDIDILVIAKETASNRDQDKLSAITFGVNLIFGTNISATAVDLMTWESGVYSVLPIHHEIKRDGMVI